MAVIKQLLFLCLLVAAVGAESGSGEEDLDPTSSTTVESTTYITSTPTVEATTSDQTTTEEPTTMSITTPEPGPCASRPCGLGSTCEELYSNYTCVCQTGQYYNYQINSCILAKTFPNDLTLNLPFTEDMKNKQSKEFQETAEQIVQALYNVFSSNSSNGYLGSTVLSLKKGSVIANVKNFFDTSSAVTADSVAEQIKSETTGILANVMVKDKNLCEENYCELTSTKCLFEKGLITCNCLTGYISLAVTQQACLPCPSGKKEVNSRCEPCLFGFSGFNCEEYYLLILVVVSVVLGVLFLSTFIATIVISRRKRKTTSSSDTNSKMDLLVLPKAATIPMISRPSQKTTSYSNTNTQLDLLDLPKPSAIPRIPRAKTNPDWQLTNLEMTNSGSTNALVTKDHTENRANGGYNGPYDDTRSYNSRSPSRMGNGHTRGNYSEWTTRNPYDQPDEDRMRRY